MIVIPGSNPVGNVLHLILGPESELISDIHGATIMDITPAINRFTTEKPIYVSISRCKSESVTVKNLTNVKIEHISSFGMLPTDGTCDKTIADVKEPEIPKVTVTMNDGVCAFCNSKGKLLPIPGQRICMTCAQIELGCKMDHKKKTEVGVKDAY